MRLILALLMIAALLLVVVSCSSGDNAVSPVTEPELILGTSSQEGQNQNQFLLGLWEVMIDKETGTIEAVDMRSSNLIINVLGFLEPPALSGMKIDNLVIDAPNNIVNVDVIVKHPINDPVFTGFDLRGVIFGPEVTNADGLTVIPSPEFFSGVPFGYQNGMLGTPDSYANFKGLAGYKYFCKDLGKNDDLPTFMSNPANLANRGVFPNGTTLKRHYDLSWAETSPPITFLVFNYAIYANFDWPTGDEPIDIDDFDIATANSAEAFCAKATETANSLWYSGGSGGGAISMDVEVWDWQGNINDVTIESIPAGVIAQTSYTSTGPGSTAHSYLFEFAGVPGNPTTTGNLDLLITATDPVTFSGAWFGGMLPTTNPMYDKPVYNCWIYSTNVGPCPEPIPTSVVPGSHAPDSILFPAVINGTDFVDGTPLDVKLKKTGQTDIAPTNISFVSATQISCDITIPLNTALGLWDVEVVNGCEVVGTGTGIFEVICPTPTVSAINPKSHDNDGTPFPATITGSSFIAGTSLKVALTRIGYADINATSPSVVSATQINCTLNIPAGTVTGAWSVRVTNGCGGTAGVGSNLFTVTPAMVGGPKNIELRGTKYPAWDLAVNPITGDLLILYSDLQVWKHPSSDYTKGEQFTETKNPFKLAPVKGWIDVMAKGFFIIGLDASLLSTGPPLAAWTHHDDRGTPVATQTNDRYHAFGDVMSANYAGVNAYDYDHFAFYGQETSEPIYTYIDQTQDTRYDPVVTTYGWTTKIAPDYSIGSLQVSLVKGLEWDKNGATFWAIKQHSRGAYGARFELNSLIKPAAIVHNKAYFATGTPTDKDEGFNNARDLTRDIKNRYLVVDILSTSALRLKAWDVTSSPGKSLGGKDLTGLNGKVGNKGYILRYDCDDNNHKEYGNILFILHGDAGTGYFLSLYYPNELPW